MSIDAPLLVPFVMALVAIVYWTSVVKPFLQRGATGLTREHTLLAGADFTRVLVALLGIGASFMIPTDTLQMTILQGATLAAIADGSYAKIIKRFREQSEQLRVRPPST